MATTPISADPLVHDGGRYLQLAARHYENFPVGSWLLPRTARLHLHRIYAFARTADDLADELRDAEALASFRRDFLRHLDSDAREMSGEVTAEVPREVPLFVDLRTTMRECQLEHSLFTDLLDAFAQDLVKSRYDEPELLDYCRRSADPIGRLVLRVCGYRNPELDRLSDRICTALQLLNHLQDLGEDLRDRDRIYFPRADLARFDVGEAQLRAPRADARVRAFVMHWAERLGADFAAGWPLVDAVQGRLRWELLAILRGAAGVLRCIRRADGDVLGGQVHLSKLVRVRSVLAGLCCRRAPMFVVAKP
ncbi:MAG: squalene synthase HpnC [Planctomycetota bacterium]